MLAIKALNCESRMIGKFNDSSAAFFEQMLRYFRAMALSGPLVEFVGSFVVAAILYQGGREILGGRLTPADFFIFLGSFLAAYGPIKSISQMNGTFQLAAAAAERIFAVLDENPTVVESQNPVAFEGLRQGIELENVSFRYGGSEQWALRGVNLRIAPGEVVSLVGLSGSGKTTLVHLLLRLFDPQEGRILIDGRDLRDYSLRSLRAGLGLVAQDTILFNETLADNVAIDDPDPAAVERALEAAGAGAFVNQLPLKALTRIGDGGLRLSGGQRQLIAIARAIHKNPAILMLDEATSNLDASGESLVQQSLERLFPGRTVLTIAHRLSTSKKADRIVVLHHGEVQESGTHADLMASDGVYAALYKVSRLEAS